MPAGVGAREQTVVVSVLGIAFALGVLVVGRALVRPDATLGHRLALAAVRGAGVLVSVVAAFSFALGCFHCTGLVAGGAVLAGIVPGVLLAVLGGVAVNAWFEARGARRRHG